MGRSKAWLAWPKSETSDRALIVYASTKREAWETAAYLAKQRGIPFDRSEWELMPAYGGA